MTLLTYLQWYTVFPQAVSRIGLGNKEAYSVLEYLFALVIQEYPKQALWLFTAVAKSTSHQRASRSQNILSTLGVSIHYSPFRALLMPSYPRVRIRTMLSS